MTAASGDFAATADAIAAAATAVPGVAGLHGGAFDEVATALPGRRIKGLRLDEGACAVHVAVDWDADMPRVADAIRAALAPLTGDRTVSVTVEDVGEPKEDRT
ncbi:Asp23/Gls24 family envelope stress response protein [Glycomyces sp. A-F 0318]|uniref:Asp23/Gls24 family envelope stress response protein n=1 Tax=Glycomyces amatae TaxID=2881355 RepID=UPI001E5ADFD0|nr:Asp23/Gls24 family envelope stress response protein [Glycomyces amatae]MCD0442416.1 Asp23/Gls24 family envelope stress response protein [Glycomyces amatae]